MIRSFKTLVEAIDFSNTNEDLSVFSKEVEQNKRLFIVCCKETFFSFYKGLKETEKKYYEILVENRPMKLYFDLEFLRNMNPEKDGDSLTKDFIELVNFHVREKLDIQHFFEDVLILESFSEQKYSIHLIFPKIVFANHLDCKEFVSHILKSLPAEDEHFTVFSSNGTKKLFIDTSVYSKNQNFRIIDRGASKSKTLLSPLLQTIQNTPGTRVGQGSPDRMPGPI